MSFSIEAANQSAARINAALEPRVNRQVDINDPDWLEKVRSLPNPLDETALREEAEALLTSLLDAYSNGDEQLRCEVRTLFAKNHAFVWATGVTEPATTLQGFRKHLLRLSAENGGRDLRDTIVAVDDLCITAKKAGLNIRHILEEVAALSSTEIVHRMSSLRRILLNAR